MFVNIWSLSVLHRCGIHMKPGFLKEFDLVDFSLLVCLSLLAIFELVHFLFSWGGERHHKVNVYDGTQEVMARSDRKLCSVLEPPDCLEVLLGFRETALDAVHQSKTWTNTCNQPYPAYSVVLLLLMFPSGTDLTFICVIRICFSSCYLPILSLHRGGLFCLTTSDSN